GVKLVLPGRGPLDPQTNPAIHTWGPTFGIVQDSAAAWCTLTNGSGFGDAIVYSLNQVSAGDAAATPFPPMITIPPPTAGVNIGKPCLVNPYIGILLQGGRHVVDHPSMGALSRGVVIDQSEDFISMN